MAAMSTITTRAKETSAKPQGTGRCDGFSSDEDGRRGTTGQLHIDLIIVSDGRGDAWASFPA